MPQAHHRDRRIPGESAGRPGTTLETDRPSARGKVEGGGGNSVDDRGCARLGVATAANGEMPCNQTVARRRRLETGHRSLAEGEKETHATTAFQWG
jgi:hypothetical protein